VNRLLRCLCVLALAAGPIVAAPIGAPPAAAAPADLAGVVEPIMLVVDTSGSMADDDGSNTGTTKVEGARAALLDLLFRLPADSELGLRTYPGSSANSCDGGSLDIRPGQKTPREMAAEIQALSADGDTPTAEALEAAGADLRAAGYRSATLVLVSDGLSTCEDPCPVAAKLGAAGLAVTVNTVGFRIESEGADELRCIANATGGTYTDVKDSKTLGDALASLNAAVLDVKVNAPRTYSPSASASLRVEVAVRNTSTVAAPDLRAGIVFDPGASGGSPTVVRPVRVLGNLAGGGTATATWDVYPSTTRILGRLEFTVTVTRRGGPPVVMAKTVTLEDKLDISSAGEVFQDVDHVVVVGDSYSAGEGGGVGQQGHQYSAGGCHRSSNTYATQLFASTDAKVTNLACSGAVIRDYEQRQNGRDVPPQRDPLRRETDADLVFLTMGGNDINFAAIIQNCLFGFDCSAGVVNCLMELGGDALALDLPICDKAGSANPLLWQAQLGDLRPQLEVFYRKVLDDTARSGARVVVLPYPNVVPDGGLFAFLACQRAIPGIDDRELALIRWLEDELNRQIALAVATVRNGNSRLYLANDVVHAVEPDHTLCGEERWINGVFDQGSFGALNGEKKQELVHPNRAGYGAEAAALLRWSRTVSEPAPGDVRDGRPGYIRVGGAMVDAADNTLEATVRGATDLWHTVQDIDLRAPTIVPVVPGIQYRVNGGGFEPGGTVVVSAASQPQALATAVADENGEITAVVRLPEHLPHGEHTLFASGFTPDGDTQIVGRPLLVFRPSPAGPLTVGAGAAVFLLVGLLLVRTGRRRRRGRRLTDTAA
jgi:lysophospholipase L1-like esterase